MRIIIHLCKMLAISQRSEHIYFASKLYQQYNPGGRFLFKFKFSAALNTMRVQNFNMRHEIHVGISDYDEHQWASIMYLLLICNLQQNVYVYNTPKTVQILNSCNYIFTPYKLICYLVLFDINLNKYKHCFCTITLILVGYLC